MQWPTMKSCRCLSVLKVWQGARSCHQSHGRGRRLSPGSTRRTRELRAQHLPATQPIHTVNIASTQGEAWHIGPPRATPSSPSSSSRRRRGASAMLLSVDSICSTILIYSIILLLSYSDILFYNHYIILLSCLYLYIMMFGIRYVFCSKHYH